MMDTRTLVVGQKVWLQSGFREATVSEITEKYVMVEPILGDGEKSGCQPSVEFNYDGTQRAVWNWVDAWDPRAWYTQFGPWELVDNASITGD
jgi:hypothetical protein